MGVVDPETCGKQDMSSQVVMNLLRVLARRQVEVQGLVASGTQHCTSGQHSRKVTLIYVYTAQLGGGSPLLDLGLERLAPRRLRLYKVWAQRTARDSRHRDKFIPSGARPRPGKHVQMYRTPQTRTAAHYNSAVPYLTRLLNGFQLVTMSLVLVKHGWTLLLWFCRLCLSTRFSCEQFIMRIKHRYIYMYQK